MQFSRICAKVTGMSRRPAPRSRGWSAAAIALFVVAQILALTHAAEVQHVRCATHGELVEAANIDVHSGDGARFVGARAGTGGDEHCELAAALHHAASAPRPSTALLATTPIALVAITPPEAVVATTVYLFAPKTSPPDLWVSLT
jgi:hypothetical protein